MHDYSLVYVMNSDKLLKTMADQSQKIAKQESNRNDFVSRYGKLFLGTLVAFCVVFGIFLVCANWEFRKSQEKIKQSYVEHIQKADSLYLNMISYNNDYISHMSDANATVLTDSLIRLTLGPKQRLSAEQYNRLHELLITQFEETKQLHERYDGKIQRDSLQLMTERQLLEGQVKTMLDLHLNKIEHEYSNITLWAAVLTILFLVFSFYSIFKMDSLVHQGNEGINEIRQLKRDGDVVIREISKKGEKILKENDAAIEKAKLDLSDFINNQQQIVSKSVGVLAVSVSQIDNKYNEALNSKLNELNTYIAEQQKLISEQKSKKNSKTKDKKEGKDEH